MAITLAVERFNGRKEVLLLLDGDRLKFSVNSPSRVEPVLKAARELAKALGSPYEFEVTLAPGYEPRRYD